MACSPAVTAVARIPKPVVAAVTGYALGGGCELALCADVRFAADNATLGQPEILLGIIPGAGGTQRLTRLVGPSRAKDLIFTGRFVKADEALAIGLVDRVVPADAGVRRGARLGATVRERRGAGALRAAKECIDRGLEVDLETGLEIERQQFAALFATEDRTIGMTSFLENGPGKAEFAGALTERRSVGRRDRRRRPNRPQDAEGGRPTATRPEVATGGKRGRSSGRRPVRTWIARCVVFAAASSPSARCYALDANPDNALVDVHPRRRRRRRPGRVQPGERHQGVRRQERRHQERPVQLGPRRGRLAGRRPDPGPHRPSLTAPRCSVDLAGTGGPVSDPTVDTFRAT